MFLTPADLLDFKPQGAAVPYCPNFGGKKPKLAIEQQEHLLGLPEVTSAKGLWNHLTMLGYYMCISC